MTSLPPPPVPQVLREMLKDYPGEIARLQDALNQYVEKPLHSKPYRGAIYALQGELEALSTESNNELQAARVSGDAGMIAKATHKYTLMFNAGWLVFEMLDMDDLWNYFQTNKEAFE